MDNRVNILTRYRDCVLQESTRQNRRLKCSTLSFLSLRIYSRSTFTLPACSDPSASPHPSPHIHIPVQHNAMSDLRFMLLSEEETRNVPFPERDVGVSILSLRPRRRAKAALKGSLTTASSTQALVLGPVWAHESTTTIHPWAPAKGAALKRTIPQGRLCQHGIRWV